MKKIITAILVLSMLAVIGAAQPSLTSGSQATSVLKIRALAILGKGIASNPSDAMDFMIVKFGIGKVKLQNESVIITGVLKADEEKYRLRDIVIEDDHATGKIYKNGSEVGSFDLSSVMKGDTEVWAGTMSLNGVTYNSYVISGVRPIKPSELRDRVVEYCKTHEDANCRERLTNYCKDHPNDARCKALFRAYCMRGHMDDIRCREEFAKFCKDNPRNKYCIPFELKRAKRYCEEHSDSHVCRRIAEKVTNVCERNPNNEGCARVKRLVEERPKLLERLHTLRRRLSNITTQVALPVMSSRINSEELLGGG